jgi:hypothetical protein
MNLWNEAFKTDPSAVKEITGKTYKGNSPKPYWLIQRATKIFGACGIGWGIDVVSERFQQVSPDDYLHVATVRVWYVYKGERGHVEQMGGTKAAYKTKAGGFVVDEDAGKKSVTDAMVKCLSMLGFAGDIFSGRWDDSKYVESSKQHFAEEKASEIKANLPAIPDERFKKALAIIAVEPTKKLGIVQSIEDHFSLNEQQKQELEAS